MNEVISWIKKNWKDITIVVLAIIGIVLFICVIKSNVSNKDESQYSWEIETTEKDDDNEILYKSCLIDGVEYWAIRCNNCVVPINLELAIVTDQLIDGETVLCLESEDISSYIGIGKGTYNVPYSAEKSDRVSELSEERTHSLFKASYVLVEKEKNVYFQQIKGGYQVLVQIGQDLVPIGTTKMETYQAISKQALEGKLPFDIKEY